jgi:hypothetical protein
MFFRKVKDKRLYDFRDAQCIGLSCWAAGMYQHRSPLSGGGSRNTGSPDTACCLNRAYHGCPSPLPFYDLTLTKKRTAEGWRKA